MALNIAQVEEVLRVLTHLPRLIDRLQQRSADFFDESIAWLKLAEQVCETHRIPAASELATLRALLIQASRGQNAAGPAVTGKPTRRKIRDASATHALDRAGQILRGAVDLRLQQLAEGERIAGQIAAVARVKGYVQRCAGVAHPAEKLALLRELIEHDADLLGAHTQLVGLLGKGDAVAVLDRSVPDL